jgi:hypothetical protein
MKNDAKARSLSKNDQASGFEVNAKLTSNLPNSLISMIISDNSGFTLVESKAGA